MLNVQRTGYILQYSFSLVEQTAELKPTLLTSMNFFQQGEQSSNPFHGLVQTSSNWVNWVKTQAFLWEFDVSTPHAMCVGTGDVPQYKIPNILFQLVHPNAIITKLLMLNKMEFWTQVLRVGTFNWASSAEF